MMGEIYRMAEKKAHLKKEKGATKEIERVEVRLPVELEEPIVGTAVPDEKLEDGELLVPAAAEEDTDEEAPLDAEDLNPFGDSWEE